MEKQNKLGGGILLISYGILFISLVGLLGASVNLYNKDAVTEMFKQYSQIDESLIPQTSDYILSILYYFLNGLLVGLILMKKKIGVFGYFSFFTISTVYKIITFGFTGGSILFPPVIQIALIAVYGYLIYQKRELFGFTVLKSTS